MSVSTLETLTLPEDSKELLQEYVRHLKKAFSPNLEGIILFGSAARGDFIAGRSNLNLFLVFGDLSGTVLREGGALQKKLGKQHVVPPLMMTKEELRQSCDIFPLEYLLIKESHILLEGRDPFPELHVSLDRLGWHCEKEVLSNLIQVRQRFLEGESRPDAVQTILILSITALLPALRGILRLLKQSSLGTDMDVLDRFSRIRDYDATSLVDALKMKRGLSSPGALEWLKVYERYLQGLTNLLKEVQSLGRAGCL